MQELVTPFERRLENSVGLVIDLVEPGAAGCPQPAGRVEENQRSSGVDRLVDGPVEGALTALRAVYSDDDGSGRDAWTFHVSTLWGVRPPGVRAQGPAARDLS